MISVVHFCRVINILQDQGILCFVEKFRIHLHSSKADYATCQWSTKGDYLMVGRTKSTVAVRECNNNKDCLLDYKFTTLVNKLISI
jgi:hypothetical protein